jgi:hypothetical protein
VSDAKGVIVALKWKRIANREVETKILQSCFVINPLTDKRCNSNVQTSNVHKEEMIVV